MRFPNPVTAPCITCGHPTVIAETSIGSLRVHCGTWHWQCEPLITGTPRFERDAVPSAAGILLDAAIEQQVAA